MSLSRVELFQRESRKHSATVPSWEFQDVHHLAAPSAVREACHYKSRGCFKCLVASQGDPDPAADAQRDLRLTVEAVAAVTATAKAAASVGGDIVLTALIWEILFPSQLPQVHCNDSRG